MADSFEEKTETASPFRREEFRKQGKVAFSRELTAVALLLALAASFSFSGGKALEAFKLLATRFFTIPASYELGKSEAREILVTALQGGGRMLLPFALALMGIALLASVAQVGFHVTWQPLTPDWNRISPATGFKRLFSMNGFIEAAKAAVKMTLVLTVTFFFFRSLLPLLGQLLHHNAASGSREIFSTLVRLIFVIGGALIVPAGLDYWWKRRDLENQMKMTKSEAKEEFKLREGDPLIKSRIRAIQRKIARSRMMEAVPKADVVVTNPTHFAVALQYDMDEMPAPKVVAKGAGEIALKIKEMAKKHQVPCVENRPLARTLFKEIEVGHYVPRELYRAVSEVLSYVYRLKGTSPFKRRAEA